MIVPVVIVGLGRIGAGNEGLAVDLSLDHLSAVRATPGLAIAGLVERSDTARKRVCQRFADLPHDRIVRSLVDLPPADDQVIALCTPTEGRDRLLDAALARKPRLVILEKPIATSLAAGRAIAAAAERAGVPLIVNYHRRFDPRHRRWRERRPDPPVAVAMRYGKGLHNYGSHLIDLLLDWYGPIAKVQALGEVRTLPDGDHMLSLRCRMTAGFDAVVTAVSDADYDIFDVDLLGRDSLMELRAGGSDIRLYRATNNFRYRGYRHLKEVEQDEAPVGGFAELYAAISDTSGRPDGCDANTALANLAVIEAALRSSQLGGTEVVPEISLAEAA